MTFIDDNTWALEITGPSELGPTRTLTQDQESRLLIMQPPRSSVTVLLGSNTSQIGQVYTFYICLTVEPAFRL